MKLVTKGLSPQITDGVGISIPTAGYIVSAYALEVVVGTPPDRHPGRPDDPRTATAQPALFRFAAHNKVTALLAVFRPGMVSTILVPMPLTCARCGLSAPTSWS